MKRIFTVLFSVVALSAYPALPGGKIQFHHFGKDTELAQATINGIYQDEYGTMWFGTRNGVKRYNGNRFESVSFHDVTDGGFTAHFPICGDRQGHVFINVAYKIVEYDLSSDSCRVIFTQEDRTIPPSLFFDYGKEGLWIGLDNQLYCYREKELVPGAVLPPEMRINCVKETSDGVVYIGTRENGLYRMEPSGTMQPVLPLTSLVLTIFEDSRQNLWVGTFNEGLFKIAPGGAIERLHSGEGSSSRLTSNYVRDVGEDNAGNLWIGTMRGIDLLYPESGEIVSYGLAENGRTGLSNLSVWLIYKDDMGTMWIGTYYGGLNYCNPETSLFTHLDIGTPSGSGYPIVGDICEDRRGNLWIGTEGNGLAFLDRETGRHRWYVQGENSIPHNNIIGLHYDPEADRLWIGTHIGGLCSYDIARDTFTRYRTNPENPEESVHGVAQNGKKLYIGALSNVYVMDLDTEEIRRVRELDGRFFEIKDILFDSRGQLWVGGNDLCRYNPATGETTFFREELAAIGVSVLQSNHLYENSSGQIVIGTSGNGVLVYDPQQQAFTTYNSRNTHLANDYITSVGEMQNGFLIAGSNTGFSCINTAQGRSYNFDPQSGFPLISMLPGGITHSSRHEMILGGVNGIALFDDDALLTQVHPVKLHFSQLWINNQQVTPRDETGILRKAFLDTGEIDLKYNQNNISVEIGHNNFIHFGQPEYQYMLEGFDNDWIGFTPQAQIRYMNLPYGRYKLRVRSSFFQDYRDAGGIVLELQIRPPVYLTGYAFLLYVLVIGAIVYFFRSRLILRTSLELERREKEQQQEITDTKQRFFANMSHELRTPLTLISGQLELLLLSEKLPEHLHKSISEIHGSAGKMNRLISELLDFLKYSRGKFRLKVIQQDLIAFVRDIHSSFSALARLKGMELTFHSEPEQLEMWFDPAQMQKVFYNLLSNAFKYTAPPGSISIRIEPDGEQGVRILIRDNGIGIPDDMKEKIFERFYQVENQTNKDWSQTGTGIGLSLTRNIIAAHHGSIRAESDPAGGSVFIIRLPSGNDVFRQDPLADPAAEELPESTLPQIGEGDREFLEELSQRQKEITPQARTILIVEDDASLRRLLTGIFDPFFRVLEADNGEDGYRTAVELSPDLILSDVMMPGMTGNELCRKIKTNFDTCHIPVVLLTALGGVEHQIDGLQGGADDYIAKPFHIRLLVTRCMGILNNRLLLQQKFTRQEDSPAQIITTNSLDRNFLEQAVRIVEENLEHGNIDVRILCSQLAVSRTKLFIKMKGLTGQTPYEFIQSIKLKRAAKMLREQPELNISEITYFLGFSSLNYFGKYFRHAFGVSPTAYRKSALNPDEERPEESAEK